MTGATCCIGWTPISFVFVEVTTVTWGSNIEGTRRKLRLDFFANFARRRWGPNGAMAAMAHFKDLAVKIGDVHHGYMYLYVELFGR